MQRQMILLAALGAGLVVPSRGAEVKPDFSGTWILEIEKSEFGLLPAPTGRTVVIEHKEPNLKMAVHEKGKEGEPAFSPSYTTDGKECMNTRNGDQIKSRVTWDGRALLINSTGRFMGAPFQTIDRWSRSEDGTTLTMDRQASSPLGETHQRQVFERQRQ